MPATKGLFIAKGAKGYGIPRRHIRTAAFLSAAAAMLLFYTCVLIPRIKPHDHGEAQAEAPVHLEEQQDPERKSVSADKRPHPRSMAERTQQQRQKQARGVSGVHKHDHEKPSFEARRPSASRPDQPLQSQTQATPKPKAGKSPEVHPEVETAHGANSASASSSSLHSPPESSAAQGGSIASRPHRRSKEQVLDGDMQKASAVVDTLTFPKTAKWEKRAPRVVVSKENSANKYVKGKPSLDVLPAADIPMNKYKTCAVVGNGGVMLSKKWGKGIDNHDAVFRFNDGPTAGFEANVGSKTTFRLINNKWTHFYSKKHPKGASEENIVLFGHGAVGQGGHLAHAWPDEHVLFLAPEFAGQARGQYKNGQAALTKMGVVKVHGRNSAPTGIEGIFMALAICQKVHLYGFGIEPDPAVPYHYHDKVKGVEAAHSFGFQALLLKLLNYKRIFGLCVPGHDTEECMDPSISDLSAYDTAVVEMAAAAEANPDRARIEAAAASGGEDGEEMEEA